MLLVTLDDFDIGAGVGQMLGEIICRAGTAEEHNRSRLLLHQTEIAQQLLNFCGRCGQTDGIAAFQHKITVGDEDLFVALYETDQELRAVVFDAHLGQTHTVESRVVFQAYLDHFHVLPGKCFDFDGGRQLEHVVKLFCRLFFRIDGKGKGQFSAHEAKRVVIVFGIADTCDSMLGAHAACKKAGEHIQFVRVGYGNEYIGVFDTGLGERFAVGSISDDAHCVIDIGDFRNNSSICIKRCDVMTFCGQRGENGGADFSAPCYKNFHIII